MGDKVFQVGLRGLSCPKVCKAIAVLGTAAWQHPQNSSLSSEQYCIAIACLKSHSQVTQYFKWAGGFVFLEL